MNTSEVWRTFLLAALTLGFFILVAYMIAPERTIVRNVHYEVKLSYLEPIKPPEPVPKFDTVLERLSKTRLR